MTGIALMIFLLIWGLIALWLSKVLWRLINSFKKQPRLENEAKASSLQNSRTKLLQLALAALIFMLPVADEIISYPTYYKMCEDGGKYQFAPGMDAKKVFGREYYATSDYELTRLFPDFNNLLHMDDQNSGVVIQIDKTKIIDTNTGEILLESVGFKPIHSFFAIPWDGKRIPWLLQECGNHVGKNGEYSQELIRKLRLKRTISLDEIRSKRGEI